MVCVFVLCLCFVITCCVYAWKIWCVCVGFVCVCVYMCCLSKRGACVIVSGVFLSGVFVCFNDACLCCI